MASVNDKIRVGSLELKNRITYAPTVKFGYTDGSGLATDAHVEHYRKRAAAGLGLICVEATAVTPDGRFGPVHMGLYEDGQIEGQKRIADAVHEAGAKVIIQLNHTGITTNPAVGRQIGPSAVQTRGGGMSEAMTKEEILAMEDAFRDAAVRAKKAGYDGIQIHACHSYLINQFHSPRTNLRTDEFGGSEENRARFGADIIRKIREACGPEFLISARVSGFDPDVEGSVAVAEEYVKAGCEYLQISNGIEPLDALSHDPSLPYSDVAELGVRFHEHFKGRVPVSSVNGFNTPEKVEYMLENDLVDTVDLSRALLADPAFSAAVLTGAPYVQCFGCPRCQYGPRADKDRCPARIRRESGK